MQSLLCDLSLLRECFLIVVRGVPRDFNLGEVRDMAGHGYCTSGPQECLPDLL